MTLYVVPGRGIVDDQQEDIPFYGELPLPDGSKVTWGDEGISKVPEYTLSYQFPSQEGSSSSFQWMPGAPIPQMPYAPPGYIQQLLHFAEQAEAGQLKDYEREQWEEMRTQALAVPTRELARLTPGARGGYWVGFPEDKSDPEWVESAWRLTQSSPDLGAIMLGLRDKIRAGSATDAERSLFENVRQADAYQNWVATTPQPSDAFNPLSNEFFMALGTLGAAAGGAAAFGAFAPVAAGGAAAAPAAASAAAPSILGIPTSTLGTIGAIGSYGGMGANVLGAATGQPWLQKVGLGLGVLGGLAGGAAGLGNLASTGIRSVGDVARLAGSAGRITGALGRATGTQPLQQVSRYLGLGSQLGSAGSGVAGLLSAAQGVQEGATQGLTDAATGGRMDWNDWGGGDFPGDYSTDIGAGDWYSGVSDWSGYGTGDFPGDVSSLQDQVAAAMAANPSLYGFGGGGGTGGGWLGTALGALGSVGGFLGKNASWLGPAVSGLTSLGAGAMGASAASDAAALQAAALNRGIDLQTAQWLATQANQAPWLEAGRSALGQLQTLAGQAQPTLGQVAPLSGAGYALPSATPGWTPGSYGGYTPTDVPSAAGYRYTPGQGPRAGDYRYAPGAIPAASQYRYTPGAVPTLSGQALLANDPGVQFRLDRAQRALEASQAARGGALSGSALRALQEQGQDLASQEYGAAWQRASQQAQLREQWAQTASQMGYGQAMSEAQLREQVNQIASQQGWSQAQAEAAFREQLAQQSQAQNWSQAAQEAQMRAQQGQFGWQADFNAQQQGQRERQAYDEMLYSRLLGQNQLQYGRDWAEREAQNQRLAELFNAQRLAQGTQFNQWSNLAGLGQTSLGQLGQLGANYGQQMGNLYGQLGTAQGQGALSSGNAWTNTLGNLGNAAQGAFGNVAFQNQLTSLLGSLNA